MLSPKTVDAKFLSTLAGAGFGASALEGDGDIFGAAIGLSVGAFAGSQVKLDLPQFDKYVQKNHMIKVTNKPVSEIERLKEELKLKIKNSSEGFEFLPDTDVEFDKSNPFSTLTNKNIESAIDSTQNLSDLKTINSIVKNENNIEKIDTKTATDLFRAENDITRSTKNSNVESKVDILKRYFKEMGYKGKELDDKTTLFAANIKKDTSLVVNRHTNTVSIDSKNIKVTSNFAGKGGISSHVNNDNYSAVRKLNPFAAMYLEKEGALEGRAVAQALGINFADAAREENIARQIEEFARTGAKPDDLKALLMQSSEFSESSIDQLIGKSYQHMERESGLRAMGDTHRQLEARATDLAQNISNQMSVHNVFNTNKEGLIQGDRPFRSFSATARSEEGSELHQYQRKIAEELNIANPQHNIKAGHSHLLNVTGKVDGLNALAPSERSQSTTGSRENPIHISSKTKNKVVSALATLKSKGEIPREFSTSSAVSRLTVDKDHFNLVAKYLDPKMTSSLADGSSIAKASIRKDYAHSSFKKYDIFSKDASNILLHSDIKDHVIARNNLGISFNAPEIKSKRYEQLISKLERVEIEGKDLSSNVNKNSKKVNLSAIERNRQKQKNLKASIELGQRDAKKEITSALAGLKNQDSGDAKALNAILTSMDMGTKEGASKLEEYRKVANKKFKGGTVIGINPNGSEVKLSTEFNDHKLVKSFNSVDSNADSKASFVFRGIKDTGTDQIVKDFGVSGKVVVNNVSDNEFDLRYGITQALNKTGYIPEEKDGVLSFNTNIKDANGEYKTKTLDEMKVLIKEESLKAKASGVGMITDIGDAGQKLSTEIFNTLNKGGSLKDVKTLPEPLQIKLQSIADNIETKVRSLGLTDDADVAKAVRGRQWALGQLATSLTEGKATSESVMGTGILGIKNINNLIDTIELDPSFKGKESKYAFEILGENFDKYLLANSLGDFDGMRTKLTDEFVSKFSQVKDMYSISNLGKNVATGDIFGEDVQKVFNLAYLSERESTHIASSDIDTIMRLGSGSRGKSLSHTAQLQLKMTGGWSSADFDSLGQHNAQDVYDLKFSSELGKPVDKSITINSFLDTKDTKYKSDFLKTIGRLQPERIDQFLISENVPEQIRNQDFLYYAMENKNSQNITTVPIHKHQTTRIGSYVLPNGKEVFKGLQGEVRDLISTDQSVSASGGAYVETFEKAVNKLSNTVKKDFLSANNPQMKGTLALEVSNSVYALSRQTSNKKFDDLFSKYAEKGHSVVGATRETAIEFLRGQGIEANKSNLHEFINKEGLLQTQLSDGSLEKSLFLENREPANSSNSVRNTYMMVLGDHYSKLEKEGLKTEKEATAFVYHSSKDKHYVELMFGDEDGDNTTLYSDNRKLSVEEYKARELRAESMATNRNKLIELNEVLKIKGKSDKDVPLYSMYDIIEKSRAELDTLGIKDNSPEFFNHLATKQQERIFQGTLKGSAVKTTSPGVTQLALGLAESAFQMKSFRGELVTQTDREAMGTLGHGLVENLLKTKHTKTETFANVEQTPVEALIQARDKFAISDTEDTFNNYKTQYNKQFEAMIPDVETRAKYQTDIDRLFQADVENIKNPRENPSNTMHVAKNTSRIRNGGVDVISDIVDDIATSRNTTGISQLATEEIDTNIERSLKVSYNDLLSNGKQNLLKNKFPLMLGAGGLALGALITQKDPNFQPSKKARADTGSMMLAPNVVSQEQSKQSDPMILQNLGRVATDYIGPETSLQDIKYSVKKAIKIQGSYQHMEQDMHDNMKEAIFGNNISNVRIERDYD